MTKNEIREMLVDGFSWSTPVGSEYIQTEKCLLCHNVVRVIEFVKKFDSVHTKVGGPLQYFGQWEITGYRWIEPETDTISVISKGELVNKLREVL